MELINSLVGVIFYLSFPLNEIILKKKISCLVLWCRLMILLHWLACPPRLKADLHEDLVSDASNEVCGVCGRPCAFSCMHLWWAVAICGKLWSHLAFWWRPFPNIKIIQIHTLLLYIFRSPARCSKNVPMNTRLCLATGKGGNSLSRGQQLRTQQFALSRLANT